MGMPDIEFTNPDNDVRYYNFGMISMPFARDGSLWYLLYFFSEDLPINKGYFTVDLPFYVGNSTDAKQFTFRWNTKYDSREEVIEVNKTAGDVTVTKVRISPTCLTVYAERPSGGEKIFLIDSITLADGTVYPAKEAVSYGFSGGRLVEGPNPKGSSGFARYLLLPNHSFDTPEELTSLIPADEITAITVDGVTIPIR